MKSIKDQENLSQKKVLLRLDLNVPLKNGVITDQTRIDKILPNNQFFTKQEFTYYSSISCRSSERRKK